MMLKVGCSEQILEVPLFAELYGYGPFAGRRNTGVHDPLCCRTVSFNNGGRRAMIVYTDTCTTDDLYAREMRARIATELNVEADGIAFIATHTHSAPKLGRPEDGIAWGEPHPEFQKTWKRAVMKVAEAAIANEEEIVSVEAGAAPLSMKLGANRVEVEKNVTDPAIRWAKFLRPDGSCKLLLHNHGVHGVSMNLPFHKLVSADWMGAANRLIRERKLADMPLFMLGACGDINTYTSCNKLKNDTAAELIASQYIADLEKDMANGGEKITDMAISSELKTLAFPDVPQTAAELRKDAATLGELMKNHADRLQEMAILLEHGKNLHSYHDLQVIRIGGLSMYFIPGELFIEPGMELLEKSPSKHPFIATVANGNGTYFPSGSDMKNYPTIESVKDCKNNCAFGYYEIYGYMHSHRFKYRDDIASFVVEELLALKGI